MKKHLEYRLLSPAGKRSPRWLLDLVKSTGVYVFRSRIFKAPLYVGSSTGRLKKTILRHVQVWDRRKGFWEGVFADDSHDPGVTYARALVEVAVRVLPASELAEEERRLIEALRPRDNKALPGGRDDAGVPF